MPIGTITIIAALAYIGLLFALAFWADKPGPAARLSAWRDWIYPLSLSVYCTSWTFFGSVGFAARQGFDFLTIYIGPAILFALFWPAIQRIVRISKSQNITSIADFLGARYGKSPQVAAVATLLLTAGMIPYIALQLKAVSSSLKAMLSPTELSNVVQNLPFFGDIALVVAITMAIFAMLFGTRHADATEHQTGLMVAVAGEAMVKLTAFLIVGAFVVFGLFGGPFDLITQAASEGRLSGFSLSGGSATTAVMTLLSFLVAFTLPHMFHVGFVESHRTESVKRAAWLFPLYLLAINLFVAPIALAGMTLLPYGFFDADMFVINLPLVGGHYSMALVAFLGGLSASTAMVMVVSVSLAIMISNDLLLPMVVRLRGERLAISLAGLPLGTDMARFILLARRTIIVLIMAAAYLYYRVAGDAELASIGLLAFAAVAQLAPAFFGGLLWRRGTARGAIAGITSGGLVWFYTQMLPNVMAAGPFRSHLLEEGPFGIAALRPQALFGTDMTPLVHGVVWSLAINIAAYLIFSFARPMQPIEGLQAQVFAGPPPARSIVFNTRPVRASVTVGDLRRTVARYLGEERTERSFHHYAALNNAGADDNADADIHLLRYAEHLLASAIGAASSRLVLSLLLRNQTVSPKQALKLLDDANAAMQYNRDVLQTALEHARQGVSVMGADQRLVVWNRPFADGLGLPRELLAVGAPVLSLFQHMAEQGLLGPGDPRALAERLLAHVSATGEPHRERLVGRGVVLEIRSAAMPDGAIVTTYTDVTDTVAAEEELEQANERLEARVRERTEELTRLNAELARAKAEADEANISKTRFLAAASHDILQPLNAARLYASSLVERQNEGEDGALARNLDASLEAVEDILGALLDISRLDAGAMKPEFSALRLDDMFRQLAVEFQPMAQAKGLKLVFVPTGFTVRSDRKLLRRILQNLVSNAIKYTPSGKVLVGVRRRKGRLRLEVHDTGLGIPQNRLKTIFKEFQRLEAGAKVARGLGLGLSIVERMARVLGHKLDVTSQPGKGSCFALDLATAAAVPVEPGEAAPPPVTAPLSGLVVLAIDNEPDILKGMAALLGQWGCRVVTGPDVRQALAALADVRHSPDVVIADYHLDDANGIDAIIQLRWRFGPDLPAILITADRTPEVREAAEAKDIHLLNKPVKPAALRALLTRWKAVVQNKPGK